MATAQGATGKGEYAYSSRVRNPLRVLLAMWRVTRDITNTYEAGIVEIWFARSRTVRRFARWDRVVARMKEQDPKVRAAFDNRLRLGWIDVDALMRLPEGTLGRVYANHLRSNGLNPNLVQIPVDDDGSYFLAHAFETHDIWHVVTGCGTDEPGEFAVAGFYTAQTEAPFFAFLLGLVLFNTAFFEPDQFRERLAGLSGGFQAATRTRPLFGTDWASLWETPIEEVRRDLGLDAQPHYAGAGIQAAA